jgi:general stress protein 26
LNSQKGNELKDNPNATMCFHWKSLLRQIRIVGTLKLVDDKTADDYYNTTFLEDFQEVFLGYLCLKRNNHHLMLLMKLLF